MKNIAFLSLFFLVHPYVIQCQHIEKAILKTWISISAIDCNSNSVQSLDDEYLLKIKFLDSSRIGILASTQELTEFSALDLNHYTHSSYRIVENKIKLKFVEYEINSICHDTLKLILRNGNNCIKYIMLEENAYKNRILTKTVPKYKTKFLNNHFVDSEGDTIRLSNEYFSPVLLKENKIDRKQRRAIRRSLKRIESNHVIYKLKFIVKDDGSLSHIEFLNKEPEQELEVLLKNMVFNTAVEWQPVKVNGLYYHSAVNWYLYVNFERGKYELLDPLSFPSLGDPEIILDDIMHGLFFIKISNSD